MVSPNTPLSSIALQSEVDSAVEILCQGGLVGFPTETVYGLGADASNPKALKRLYEVKGRPSSHPVIVHVGNIQQLSDWARDIPPLAWDLAEAFWPGPLTLILPRASHVLDEVTGGQDTVGLRLPSHPLGLQLLKQFQGGIAAPSANRFGQISPTSAHHVQADLQHDVDLILDGGPCPVGVESTIVDVSRETPVLLRPGMISQKQLEDVIGHAVPLPSQQNVVSRSPGTLLRHYAPTTPLHVVPTDKLEQTIEELLACDNTLAVLSRQTLRQNDPRITWIQSPDNPEGYAQNLYHQLRKLDKSQCSVILVEAVPSDGLWHAVYDRLQRASYQTAKDTSL